MVKKKGHRDVEKKLALTAKKEAKQEKAAKKRLIKLNGGNDDNVDDDSSNASNDSDLDTDDDNDDEAFNQLLKQYKQQLDGITPSTAGEVEATTTASTSAIGTNGRSCAAKVVLLPNDRQFPCARANATLTITDDSKKRDVYLFGGEYYDGASVVVSDQLFKYELPSTTTTSSNSTGSKAGQWKQIITASSPPPRCAHAAGYYNKSLYIFGGESSGGGTGTTTVSSSVSSKKVSSSAKGGTMGEYYHYRDIWKYDTIQQQWSEMKPSIPSVTGKSSVPTPRSGMSMTIWKHYLVLFGGFYEAASQTTPNFYNDVYVLNLQSEQWLDVPYSKLSIRPEPRSACNAALIQNTNVTSSSSNNHHHHHGDVWLIHGGFSKLQTNASRLLQQNSPATTNSNKNKNPIDVDDALPMAETIVFTDAWVLQLHPILDGKPPVWERLISSLSKNKRYETAQMIHNGRSGVSTTTYQNNMLLFGGVLDQELLHHKVESTFYNDLSIFHIERRKFIPIRVQEPSANSNKNNIGNGNGNAKVDVDHHVDHDTVDNAIREMDLNSSFDNDGEGKLDDRKNVGWDIDKLRTNMFAFVDGNGSTIYEKIDSVIEKRRQADEVASTQHRIVERTEPLPRIKACIFMNGHVLYIYGGILEIGDREVTLDDMWSIDLRKNRTWQCLYPGSMHEQIWRGAVYDDDDSYYSNNTNKDDDLRMKNEAVVSKVVDEEQKEVAAAESTLNKETSAALSINPKKEMIELVERYIMDDDSQTPRPSETLSDFFLRTEQYWTDHTRILQKPTDESHSIAQMRYDELVPIMQRLTELKLLRKKEKANQKQKR